MPIYKTDSKRDGRQGYRVVVSYKDGSGKNRQKERRVYGLPEAKAAESQMIRRVKEAVPARKMTLQQLYGEYITAKQHEVRETTLDKSRRILNRYILPPLGGKSIDKLDKPTLQGWKSEIAGRDLAFKTKQNLFKEFSALLNWAVKMDYLPKNPLSELGNFREVYFEQSPDKLHYYTAEQFKEYIAVARSEAKTLTDWGYYIFFNIAFYTGMRKGEINALKWSDIEGDTLHVRRSVAQKIKGKPIVETPPKNKSSYRDLQIPAPLLRLFEEHKARQQKDRRFSEDFRICGGPDCLRDSSIENRNTKFAKLAGLPHIRIHDFRHTHATLLINEGINIQEIARRLGHSNVQITWGTYAHLYPREEERAIKILNKIE